MKTWKALALAGVAGAVAISGPALSQRGNAPAQSEGAIEGQYICVFDSNVIRRGQVVAAANRAANANGGNVLFTYRNSINGFATRASARGVENMQRANPWISYCVQDEVVTLAPPPGRGNGGGGGGDTGGQTTPWGIDRVGGFVDGSGFTRRAWILDSGIDLDHPDLNVDVARSADFTGSRKGAEDENGHGTHVAGTVAAINNNTGVVGVAAGAPVVAVRVLNRRGSGSYSGIIAGVDYVAANASPGDVANMSLGGGRSQALNDAVEAAAAGGVHMVLAAGNESQDAANVSPASATGTRVYTISATDRNDNFASFSNFGAEVDYAEPGVSINSTWLSGGYNTISGTSMAAPHAAGILLATGGTIRTSGFANNDPDGNADPIGVR
ncbi:S8 family serine peptidase [Aurantiacibacter gangjinensis]|uniref:S8 family serine peptidase n=1 Tax=Aurantiacibacter gangjinensis TaxID=502682 RepID=UPI0009E1FABD|nr:S8 family serine peptidase [Aurantiacibacter gangjinensis]